MLEIKYIPVYISVNDRGGNLFIFDVCQAFQNAKIPYAIVGGYAVSLHGAVRATVDLDIVVRWSLPNLQKTEKVLSQLGLKSRLPIEAKDVFNFREEYINNRNLKAWNFYSPKNPVNQVDIVITYDLSRASIKTIQTMNGKIKILALEDLIAMKKESGRAQDLEDIKILEKL